MRLLVAYCALLFSMPALASQPISVVGYGQTREQAKLDGFKTAIQKKCGVAVLSNKEATNNNLVRDSVVTYSGCTIKDYKITNERYDNLLQLSMDVWVIDNEINNRLFSSSSQSFNGDKVAVRLNYSKLEQLESDNFIKEVFLDYPHRAFNLNKVNPYIQSDPYRNIYLVVPYEIRWNYNFLLALSETFKIITNNNRKKGYGMITMTSKSPDSILLGKRENYFTNDLTHIDIIKSELRGDNTKTLQLKVKNKDSVTVIDACYNPPYTPGSIFFSAGVPNIIHIYGNDVQNGAFRVRLNIPYDQIGYIDLSVVSIKNCKNNK